MGSMYSTADITDSYFDDAPAEPSQDKQDPFRDIILNPEVDGSSDKRASDMTLTDRASTRTKQQPSSFYAAPPPPLRRAASHDSYSRRPSNSRYPSNLQMARSQSRDVESGRRRQHGGFLSHVKDSLMHFAQDQELPSAPNSRQPSRNISRRNSWASGYEARIEQQGRELDNFERSQVINADTDDTYLIDENEGLRNRKRGQGKAGKDEEHPKINWHEFDDNGRRKTYNERRKKQKHVIRYHVECK